MSATPKAARPRSRGLAFPTAESREAADEREAEDRKAVAENLRGRWREARATGSGRRASPGRVRGGDEDRTPGLPAGNYYDDIQAAVEQQKVEREQRNILAKKALAAAKEALDAVEIEARRKQVRLD